MTDTRNKLRKARQVAKREAFLAAGGKLNALGNMGGMHGNYGHRRKGEARQRAIDDGAIRYMGEPCALGHDGQRYTKKSICCECSRIKSRDLRRKNSSLNVARARAWALKNPDKARASHRVHQAFRRTLIDKATPLWLSDLDIQKIKEMWRFCPEGMHVDHIVPVKSDRVCGLHVPWNLQYLEASKNIAKGNRLWPNDWSEA